LYKIQKAVTAELGKNAKIEIFGSVAMNLSTINSDIDLVITNVDMPVKKALRLISKHLRKPRINGIITNVFRARVPIVKFKDKKNGVECDIKISGHDDHRLKTAYVRCCVSLDSRVKPLILSLKSWAKNRKIGDASQGTLNSLGHTCLVLQFLQIMNPPILPLIF